MNNHLSDDQFSKCILGCTTDAERQHLTHCARCAGEVARFATTISALKESLDLAVDAGGVDRIPVRQTAVRSAFKLAFAASVAFMLVTVLALPIKRQPPLVVQERIVSEMDPDTLMQAVNLSLSRTVPAPMEPLLAVIPDEEPETQKGEVR